METSVPRLNSKCPEGLQESELVVLAAQGSRSAFEAIMRRYNQLLFRTARSIVRSDTDAEEVVQEAFLNAWRAMGSYRTESRLSTWLVRITTNAALGRLRKKNVQVIPLDTAMMSSQPEIQAALTDVPERGPEQSMQMSQLRKQIETRIDELPEIFRTIFVLRAIEEMSVEDVAQVLNIPEATVRTRYFRARSMLRDNFFKDMDFVLGEVFSFDGARCDRIVIAVLAWSEIVGPPGIE